MKKFWQCPTCGGILLKSEESLNVLASGLVKGVGGTATCSYCSTHQDLALVYSGAFDFHDSDDFIERMGQDSINVIFDDIAKRWTYHGEIVRLSADFKNLPPPPTNEQPETIVADKALQTSYLEPRLDISRLKPYEGPKPNPCFDLYFNRRVSMASLPRFYLWFWRERSIKCPSDFVMAIRKNPEIVHSFSLSGADLFVFYKAVAGLLRDADASSAKNLGQRLMAQCPECSSCITGEDLAKFSSIPLAGYLSLPIKIWADEAGSLLEGKCNKCKSWRVLLIWKGLVEIA